MLLRWRLGVVKPSLSISPDCRQQQNQGQSTPSGWNMDRVASTAKKEARYQALAHLLTWQRELKMCKTGGMGVPPKADWREEHRKRAWDVERLAHGMIFCEAISNWSYASRKRLWSAKNCP
jgi:hypothetical protein